MSYIPLIEHTHPRVLMVDFSEQDVAKVRNAGFDSHRGATGLLDRDKFHFPIAVQDAEVVFAQVQSGSFTSTARTPSASSIEEGPFFRDLIRETWQKAGWTILFISPDTPPEELQSVGIDRLGVISNDRHYLGEWLRIPILQALREANTQTQQVPGLPPPQIPRFRGQAVHVSNELTAKILERYIKSSAQMSILTSLNVPQSLYTVIDYYQQLAPHVVVFGDPVNIKWLVQDDSRDINVIALKLDNSIAAYGTETKHGAILILPDFQQNNVNIALALLQDVITQHSPHLFDTPQHPWLEKYQPIPVTQLLAKRHTILVEALQQAEELDNQAEIERTKYAWLLGLLVSLADEFAQNTAQALRFLGFEVEEIDNNLLPGERKREDMRIWDKTTEYFALGEAKTTGKGRGAAEEFITKTQTHQARFAHENHQEPPLALLVINYAIDLDPGQRVGRFYQADVSGRLGDNRITALNSVALFDLCQLVLNGQFSKEQIRKFIERRQPLIASITSEEVVATIDHPMS